MGLPRREGECFHNWSFCLQTPTPELTCSFKIFLECLKKWNIFFFTDGVLHDKALLEALEQQQAANESKNVKRENKAYSYKEQV